MKDLEIPLGKRTKAYRFFEMLPALLSYGAILLLVTAELLPYIFGEKTLVSDMKKLRNIAIVLGVLLTAVVLFRLGQRFGGPNAATKTPTTAKPIRTGIYRFVGNTPNVDLKDVIAQTEKAVAEQMFKNTCFREVPSKTLQAEVKKARLNIDKIIVKGWRETPLSKTVDMIILGSVAKDEKGFLIETKFHTSGGKLILSQITRARSAGDITSAAKEIASAVLEHVHPAMLQFHGEETPEFCGQFGLPYLKACRVRQGVDLLEYLRPFSGAAGWLLDSHVDSASGLP